MSYLFLSNHRQKIRLKEVKKDSVRDINVDDTERAVTLQPTIRHSPLENIRGNSFQAHKVNIKNQDDVVPALHAIYSQPKIARASHNIYAYRLKTQHGYIEHFDDDGAWGIGNKLLAMLRENTCENALVCVTGWYGGSNLGRSRLDHILKAAKYCLV